MSNLLLTIILTLFTWFLTALGSSTIFLFKNINNKIMSLMFGFGAGVMIAASFFSLLLPAISLSDNLNQITYLNIGLGFLSGCVFILLIDLFTEKINKSKTKSNIVSKNLLLILAVTLHNIPEGMAIGVAIGSAGLNMDGVTLSNGIILAIGIGLQNFPEGMAVSMPLVSDGMDKKKAFFYGQASGIVEPLSAILGYFLVLSIRSILPFILSFASGAMIYVVVEELIPTGKTKDDSKISTIGVIIGFTIMMILDIALS